MLLDEVGVEVSEPVCNSCILYTTQDTSEKMRSLEHLVTQRDQQVLYWALARALRYYFNYPRYSRAFTFIIHSKITGEFHR